MIKLLFIRGADCRVSFTIQQIVISHVSSTSQIRLGLIPVLLL